jgi:hypothetical protein
MGKAIDRYLAVCTEQWLRAYVWRQWAHDGCPEETVMELVELTFGRRR